MSNLDNLIRQTRAFYDWEVRGRGWLSHPEPVALEPPFIPFRHPAPQPIVEDDGRRPGLRDHLRRFFIRNTSTTAGKDDFDPRQEEITPFVRTSYDERLLILPDGVSADRGIIDTWLRATSLSSSPVAFEVLGEGGSISLHLATATRDSLVGNQLRSNLPGIRLTGASQTLRNRFDGATSVLALEFGLAREWMLPLRLPENGSDLLSALIGAMSDLGSEEKALFQLVFHQVRHPWAAQGLSAVTSPDGEPFFLDAPELTKQAGEKLSTPLYAVALRAMATAEEPEASFERLVAIAGALGLFADPSGNEFIPLACDDQTALAEDILSRQSHRSGMLLSLPELASLISLPGKHFTDPRLVRHSESDLPGEVLGQGTFIGRTNQGRSVRLSPSARLQHTHLVGASGTGKSTLLERMITEDMAQSRGLALLDPHGDLVDAVIGRIPEERLSDVVLFDPGSGETTIGWNVLSANTEASRRVLSSDLVALIRRQSTSWGDQMQALLGNAIDTILAYPGGGTLLDLRFLLVDEAFRRRMLTSITDDYILNFWRHDFPLLIGRKPQVPIITRLDSFLRSPVIRDAVCRQDDPIDFRELMDEGGIFLAKLSQGSIGEENCALLGSLILSAFHQAALSRQEIPETERPSFNLYADEFHLIASPSLSTLFSGVRKYGLGLTVAHQSLHQLHAEAPEVERSVLSNAYTRIVFRVAEEDARKLEPGIRPFTSSDLLELQRGEAIVRVGPSGKAFTLVTEPLEPASAKDAEVNRRKITQRSRRAATPAAASPPTTLQPQPAPRPVQPTVAKEPSKSVPSSPGRGGAVHKYLQNLIRDWGKRSGYKVEIEKEITGGRRVDVALYSENHSIACEIAGITTIEQECANIAKCLSEGFNQVVAVSLNTTFLQKLDEALTERLSVDEKTQVELATPEELSAILRQHGRPASAQRVAGYKVRVRQSEASIQDEIRRKTAAKVLLGSIRRLREKEG